MTGAIKCGSELARDDGSTVSIDVADKPLSRASLLPQGSLTENLKAGIQLSSNQIGAWSDGFSMPRSS
jgi:hypothetical protein